MLEYPISDFYLMIYAFHESFGLWILLLAVIFGFVLSFAVGANDSANSWGTPVGAGTVSFGVAVFLGSIMETVGSLFLSSEVVKTVAGSDSVVKIELYHSDNATEWDNFIHNEDYLVREKTLMLGMLSSMLSSQIWQLATTYLAWPVSGTHSIIAALFGFTVVEHGLDGVNPGVWNPLCAKGLYKVAYGLFLSSFISLGIAFVFYFFIYKISVKSKNAKNFQNRLTYTFCVFFMFTALGFTMSTAKSIQQPVLIKSDYCSNPNKSLFGLLVGLGVGLVVALPFHFLILPYLLKSEKDLRITLSMCSSICTKRKENNVKHDVKLQKINGDVSLDMQISVDNSADDEWEEADEIKNVFRPLQVIAACFSSLSHGGNDVANCVAPLVTIWFMYNNPLDYRTDQTAYQWLFWGGLGISLGLLMFGKRVILTMGTKITPMTPSLGFTSVLSASLVVMFCILLGIPTSTTHCQVMAVVGAGVARTAVEQNSLKKGFSGVDLKVFGNIALSWICTIPFAMGISAALYAALRISIIGPF